MSVIKQCIQQLCQQFDQFPFHEKNAYCYWLNQHYYLIQNTTRYLAFAASQVPVEDRQGFRWWAKHLSEEMDHDALITADLKKLDYGTLKPMLPAGRAFVLAQYQDIQNNGPEALLGYATLFEGLSFQRSGQIRDQVEKLYGAKSTFLRLHAEVDAEHSQDGLDMIEKLAPAKREIAENNAEMSYHMYCNLLGQIRDNAPALKKVA